MTATTLLADNGVTSGITGYQLTGGDDGTLQLQTTTAGGTATTAMTIDASQNVGIGTSSPAAKLQVKGSGEELRIETTGAVASGGTAYQTWYDSTGSRQAYIGFGGANNTFQINLDASGPLTFSTSGAERARIDSSGNFLFNSGYGSVATAYGCRAWVNFNGTGTVAIRGSGNVSSITDNGTGDYTVNFTTAMPDANYAPAFSGKIDETTGWGSLVGISRTAGSISTGSLRVTTANSAFTLFDYLSVNVSIFR